MKISANVDKTFRTASQLLNSAAGNVSSKPLDAMIQSGDALHTAEIGAKLRKVADENLGTVLDLKA
ncbi:MAG: hypothetical protein HQM09_06830 [Candidatus Riflebacteria bacterium]|nr:hypothetical protein [Candidatus Riflebacteria bacterium]